MPPLVVFGIGLGGFAGGVPLAARLLPPLAATREGRLATVLVRILLGAAFALLFVSVWELANDLNAFKELEGDRPLPTGRVVAEQLGALLYEVGVLLGLAGAIQLLAPLPEPE